MVYHCDEGTDGGLVADLTSEDFAWLELLLHDARTHTHLWDSLPDQSLGNCSLEYHHF